MPFAVTHILTSLFSTDFYRKKILKRKDFPLWLVLVGGIAGLLPDIDYVVYWILKVFIDLQPAEIHGLYTHTFFIPLIILCVALILRKHKTTFHTLIIIAMGYTTHLILDGIFEQAKPLLYPLSSVKLGLGLIPEAQMVSVFISLDAVLLVLWLLYEWRTKKILDFT